MTEQAEKPFWVSDDEYKGLQTTPVDQNLADNVVEGVPDLTEVDGPKVVGKYGYKDGILIYHFYHKGRKEVIDIAEGALEETRQRFDERCSGASENDKRVAAEMMKGEQEQISRDANAALAERPWWTDFEQRLRELFPQVFKYQDFKVTFYPEVDSWSVILPAGTTPMEPTKEHLELPFKHLNLALENVG